MAARCTPVSGTRSSSRGGSPPGGRNDAASIAFAIQDRIAEKADSYRREFGAGAEFSRRSACGPGGDQRVRDSRPQIAYFGDTMNVTARLQECCKQAGRALLISGDLLTAGESPAAILSLKRWGRRRCAGAPRRSRCSRSSAARRAWRMRSKPVKPKNLRRAGPNLTCAARFEPGRSGFFLGRKQFRRRIRRCTRAAVAQDHLRQILSIDTAAIGAPAPAWRANHLSSPEKPRRVAGPRDDRRRRQFPPAGFSCRGSPVSRYQAPPPRLLRLGPGRPATGTPVPGTASAGALPC